MAEIIEDSPQPVLVLSNRPLKSKLVEELRSIASEMQLAILQDPKVKKDKILKAIEHALKTDDRIAGDPRWEPLLAHRSRPKASAKTSAEKADEEAVEAAKPQLPATGAHHALLAGNVKTDPPGQYKKLSSIPGTISGTEGKALSVNESDSDSESTPASLGHQSAPHTPETKPLVLKAADVQEKSALIQVNFFNERNFAAAPRQVYVEHPVRVITGDEGQPKYVAQLSRLVPAAVEQDSPIKDRGGRLYRTNIRDDSTQHLHIGTIDAVVAGTSRALQPAVINEYVMHDTGGGLTCDLFWDEGAGDSGAGAATNSFNSLNSNGSVAGADANNTPQIENNTVGQNIDIGPLREDTPATMLQLPTDKPLDVARNRAARDPMHRDAPSELRAEFARDLHKRVKTHVPSLPDFQEEWPRCTFAGQMREPTRSLVVILSGLALVSKRTSLYKEVLNIRSSATTEIDGYFTEAMLKRAPKAKAWVDSDGVTNSSKFERLKTVDFKRYLDDHAKPDPNPRKHKKSSSDEDGNRRRRRMTSAGLDETDSSAS
ncbi:hypothetical protein MSAN_02023700 [Mycena sanguinolenta]|uniref:Uncharacterized protein n=1 Tax=Mycena sanguinolenta TaxID=230812 RepID=A0A8H6XJE6_9AGAR|nr:hypothetical protein MSAN_02023700 [Mycena sanguinolenta]